MGEHLRCQCYRESSKGFRSPRSDWPEKVGGAGGGSMGLTVSRQTASNLNVKRRNMLFFTVNRQKRRLTLTIKKFRKIPKISPSKYKPPKLVTQKTLVKSRLQI